MGTIIFCIVFGCIGFAFFPSKEIKERKYVGVVIGYVFFLAFSGTGFFLAITTANDLIQGKNQPILVKGEVEIIHEEASGTGIYE